MKDDFMAWYPRPLADLGMSAKLAEVLQAGGLATVQDLMELMYQGPAALIGMAGMSPNLVEELIDLLRKKGLIQ
jgi:hypothetical protein